MHSSSFIPTRASWPMATIDDSCDLISRGTAPNYDDDGEMLAIGQRCVQVVGFNSSPARRHRDLGARVLSVKSGDVLLNSTGIGTIGRSCIFDGEAGFTADGHVTVLRAGPTLDPRWLNLLLQSHWGQQHLEARCFIGSTGQVELSRAELVRSWVPLPPLAEQRRIAEVLDALDEQIAAEQRQVTRLRTIARATLVSELTAGQHPQVTLGEHLVGAPRNGYSPKEVEHWTGLIALGLGCLTTSGFEPRQLKNVPRGVVGNVRALLSDGDVLVSRANTRELVGMVGIYRTVGIECIYPDLMMRLRPDPDLLPEVLEQALRLPAVRRRIQALSQGTSESMVKITGEVVASLRIPLPALSDQERIVRLVRATEATVDQHMFELAKLHKLKSALMDDLLTGRVRVPVEAETLAEV